MIDVKNVSLFVLLVGTVSHASSHVIQMNNNKIPLSQGSEPKSSVQYQGSDGDETHFASTKSTQTVTVKVDTKKVVRTIDDSFVSYALDYSMIQYYPHWPGLNFTSPKLLTLMRALSPAILRLGGSGATYTIFDATPHAIDAAHLTPSPSLLEKDDVVKLVTISRSVGARLLLDLNSQQRYGDQWDPSNAIRLMDFCSTQGYGDNLDFQIGNEPEYFSKGQLGLTGNQIANDLAILNRVTRSYENLSHSRLVGPDIVAFPAVGSNAYKIIQSVVNVTGSFLTAITFHHYYFRGDVAKYQNYLDPNNFENLARTIDAVQYAVSHSKYPSTPLWITETSDSWAGGTVNVSDRFVSGFLWLDKLGLSARMGVSVVFRQVLFGLSYCLLDRNMDPNPDYWTSYVYKKLVSTKVLNVTLSSLDLVQTLRVYAHCTSAKSGMFYQGSVTVFAINISPNMSASLLFETRELNKSRVELYSLTPGEGKGMGSVLSKDILLNGKRLSMVTETVMPELIPKYLPAGQPVSIPPLSLAFLVFSDAHLDICMS